MASKLFRAAILGAPASGKGTVSSRIINKYDVVHVSSGDLLRNHIKNKTVIGKEVNKYIVNGDLVPDKLIVALISTELNKLQDKNWLLDGFPRTAPQAESLFSKNPINMAINLVVPFDVIVDRVKGRWVHVASGRVYNTDFNAPKVTGKDDVTGECLEQRPDDRPEAVQRRLDSYAAMIEPVLQYYREQGVLRDFHGRKTDEIWPQVDETLAKVLTRKE